MKKCKKRSMGLAFFVLAMALIAVLFAGCHGGGGGGGGGNPATPPATDTTAPTVTSVTPKAGTTGVALNTIVTAAFSEALDETTVNASAFVLKDGANNAVPGTVTLDVKTNMATFTPSANLAQSSAYTATITTAVKDKAGNALAADFSWSFTTGTVLDTTPPTVSPTSPADGATGVSLASEVTATFSEPVNSATINGSTFTVAVSGGGGSVAGAVSLSSDGLTATFRPAAPFASYTAYTATITTGVKDLSGNAMAANKTWSFTTERDTTPPTVVTTDPGSGATGVSRNVSIQVTFSEPMSAATITTATFLVSAGSNTVVGAVSYNAGSKIATFTPQGNLTDSTTYNCTITTGVTDLAGNHLASNYSWNFDVGTVVDTTPPSVVSTNPVDGATGVDTNRDAVSITAVFSEPMLATSVSGSTFTLVASGQTFTGAVTYDGPSRTAKFTPDIDLPKNTACTATVTTGVKDLAGNAMAANKTWSFKTRAEVNIPKTGQTSCYDGSGTLVSCATGTGQDGALRRGMAWPIPRLTSGPTTTDNLTGLVWPTNANTPACDIYTAGTKTWQAALDYVTCLNKAGYLGKTDWRLPNREELRSLLHYGQADTAAWLNGQGFTNVISSGYWSSTTDVSVPSAAWVVSLKDGAVIGGGKSGINNVWPVRGGGQAGAPAAPAQTGQKSCYDANGGKLANCAKTGQDGESQTGLSVAGSRFASGSGAELQCVTDNLTGLMWAKVPPGTALDKKTWQDALAYINSINGGASPLCGYSDWRLPNSDELASLVNADQADQSAWLTQAGQGFVGIQADLYWTSTSVERAPTSAYAVNMKDGKVDNAELKTQPHFAWPVRGGIK